MRLSFKLRAALADALRALADELTPPLEFSARPLISYTQIGTASLDEYKLLVGRNLVIGNVERVYYDGPEKGLRYEFRFTPAEEFEDSFSETPIVNRRMEGLKEAVADALWVRRTRTDALRALANELEPPPA